MASPYMTLLLRALARYRLGSQMRIMMASAEAEMMSDALDVSGSWCVTKLKMAVASVARARSIRRMPTNPVHNLSVLQSD
jgi:hypothetical protein